MTDQFTPLGYRVYAELEAESATPGIPARLRVVESTDPTKVWLFAGAGAALLSIADAHTVFSALDEWMNNLAARASREINTAKLIPTGPDPQGMGTYCVITPGGPPPAWAEEWDNAQDAVYDQE